jgi:hypothetical protein
MHEITPQALKLLKDQGVTDGEIEELRRTGRIERIDSEADATISIGANELGTFEFSPQVLDKLRRFHRFIPKATRDQIELASGVDLDGDGRIGGAAGAGAPVPAGTPNPSIPSPVTPASAARQRTSASDHEHVTSTSHDYRPSSAMPQHGATSDGPFVERSAGRSLIPWVVLLVAIGGAVWLIMQR